METIHNNPFKQSHNEDDNMSNNDNNDTKWEVITSPNAIPHPFDKDKFDNNNTLIIKDGIIFDTIYHCPVRFGLLSIEPDSPVLDKDFTNNEVNIYVGEDDIDVHYDERLGAIYGIMDDLEWNYKKVFCRDGINWIDFEEYLIHIGNPLGNEIDSLKYLETYIIEDILINFFKNYKTSEEVTS